METNLFRYIWQKSRSEQLIVLAIILASIPFYWISFDVPKRIVNDAIQGRAFKDGKTTATVFDFTLALPGWLGGHSVQLSPGITVDQFGFLLSLSLYFLLLVLINGAFKYVINVQKGVLGERMLRRMRYDLFSQLLRFRPEDIRAVKPAEVASMIKDEVEPIGGFVGEAFIQPVFLLSQALTALVFIMVQSVWLGSIALFIVLLQAIIIPILRKEQLRLGRERQIASRRLAGRIGEIVDAGPTIQGHGTTSYFQSDIAGRLGQLFEIRFALYKRKFAVKFLNNLLASVTPFFFYAIGGYFALQGRLDIGQLVAVIAAYRDLPPPIKELIDWDQMRNDVTIKYEQVVTQFSPTDALSLDEKDGVARLPETGELKIDALELLDNRGQPVLAPLSLDLKRPAHVALVGEGGAGRDALARILGRQVTSYSGRVLIDGKPLSAMSVERASHVIGYGGQDVEVIAGTLRDNILLPLRRLRPTVARDAKWSVAEHRYFIESLRAGNTPLRYEADWTDYAGAGLGSPDELEQHLRALLDLLGVGNDVYELGLNGKLTLPLDPAIAERLIAARRAVAAELAASKLEGLVETFDPDRYNANATIFENLVFGSVRGTRMTPDQMTSEPYARAILQAEALIEPLERIGTRIVETLVEIFEGLSAGHMLFERYAFGQGLDLDSLNELAAVLAKRDARQPLDSETQARVVTLALGYIEPKHRLNLVDARLRVRVLRARQSFKTFLPADSSGDVDFYDPDQIIAGASVRDNLLFGRIGYGIADSGRKVAEIVKAALSKSGLDAELYRLGLDTEAGTRGRFLPQRLRQVVPLAQALIKRPDILVLDPGSLAGGGDQAAAFVARLRDHCGGRTLFLLLDPSADRGDFDAAVLFDGASGRLDDGSTPVADTQPAPDEVPPEPEEAGLADRREPVASEAAS